MKSLNHYSNNEPYDPKGFKEEIKIKFDVVKAVVKKFPNGTGAMMELLKAELPHVDLDSYCALPNVDQLVWEERGDALTKSMLFLMNLKNDNAKKDLHLAYLQGNKRAYPLSVEAMARYMSTQYPSKNSGHQRKGKKEDRNEKKGMIPNPKTRTTIL